MSSRQPSPWWTWQLSPGTVFCGTGGSGRTATLCLYLKQWGWISVEPKYTQPQIHSQILEKTTLLPAFILHKGLVKESFQIQLVGKVGNRDAAHCGVNSLVHYCWGGSNDAVWRMNFDNSSSPAFEHLLEGNWKWLEAEQSTK